MAKETPAAKIGKTGNFAEEQDNASKCDFYPSREKTEK